MKKTILLKEIRAKSINTLNKDIIDLKIKFFELKKNLALDKLKKTSEIIDCRQKTAMTKTVIYEKLEEEIKDVNQTKQSKKTQPIKSNPSSDKTKEKNA